LHRVARHAAIRARLRSTRRRARERIVAVAERHEAEDPVERRELRTVLDEELDRLPRSFREPLVLCYLQGLTHDEAAAHLGCPVGTVRSRLARARDRLRARLTRRGLAPASIEAVALATPQSVPAALPAPLVAPTLRAASLLVGGDPASARALAGPAFSLMEGVTRMMFRKTLATVAVAVAFAAVGLVPLASLAQRALGPPRAQDPPGRIAATAEDRPKPKVAEARGDWDDLAGRWKVVAVKNSGRRVEPAEAGFNECLILAPKPDAKSGTGSAGWFILMLDGRLFCELEVKDRDLDSKPKEIDFFTVRNVPAGEAGKPSEFPMDYKAIFRLPGDELTIGLGKPNGGRPREFAAEDGSGQMIITFRRAAKAK
jgi:RNA polymerase sigma-70 factor (ECF subfamily)